MSIDAKLVAQLRAQTGAGMMDAKKALESTGGDLEKASEELRTKGIAKAAKKAGRETSEGRVHAYIHSNGKLGALIEMLCETDFVARNETFISFCNDIAMHVSAEDPSYLKREDVPKDMVEKEMQLFRDEMKHENKPEEVIGKIIEGKMNKWYGEIVLMEQKYIKDDSKTIDVYLKEQIVALGENMHIRGFTRFNI